MILIDDLLIGGVRFVLDKLAQAVDSELRDDTVLKEQLLEAQMRRELGEITEEEFQETERDLLQRIRDVRERNTEPAPPPGEMRVAAVEASVAGDEHEPEEDASPTSRR